jgi:DNA-nicking Smr family endonuclease
MFEKGQIVKFKDAGGTAKVSRIEGEIVYALDDFGFENAYDAHELLPVVEWQVGAVEHKDKRREKSGPAAQQIDRLSIDLHSHELLESTQGMTRYEILNHQLDKASATVREARRRGISKVLIIHGKGSGRLQGEVHELLRKMGGCEFYFADFSEGGYGATEVRIVNRLQ